MNETAVIVLSVVCVLIVIGIIWFLIRNHVKESKSNPSEGFHIEGIKSFGGIRTTFEDPTKIWTSQLTLPELIDVVSDLSLIGINSFLGDDSWKKRQLTIDNDRVTNFIDFSFEFSRLVLKYELDSEIDEISPIVKFSARMKERMIDKIPGDIDPEQIEDSILINFGRIWLDRKNKRFEIDFDKPINRYVGSKLICPEYFDGFQKRLKYENLIPKLKQDPLERKRFDGINLICSFFLKNLWTSHVFFDEPKYLNILKIITKTLKTSSKQKQTENNLNSSITNSLTIIEKALASVIYDQTISPELVVSMSEVVVLLREKEKVEIDDIKFIGNGCFNTCFKITLRKQRRNGRGTIKQFVLKLLQGRSMKRENLFNRRKYDRIFRGFVSYPQPILSNYEYYDLPVNSDTDPKDFNYAEYEKKFQCDWRIYKLYSNDLRTNGSNNPRLKTLKPDSVTKFEFIVSKDYKDQILSEEAEKIRFQNICKYINQMGKILFKLHSVGSVYYDWKIGNIALDEKFNFILIDNDFEEASSKRHPETYIKSHNIDSILDSVRPVRRNPNSSLEYDTGIHFQIDKIILLKELYSVFNASDRTGYSTLLKTDSFKDDDLRIEFEGMIEKINPSEFPFLYELVRWHLEDCTIIKRKNPVKKHFERFQIEIIPDQSVEKIEKFHNIF